MGDSESCSSRQSECSPVQRRKRRQKNEVYHEVLHKLKDLGVENAAESAFEDELWAHFNTLPLRYALDVNTERAEDVLMHRRLLEMAHDPITRPAVDVRLVQVLHMSDENLSNPVHSSFTRGGNVLQQDSLHPSPAFSLSSNFELAFERNKLDATDGDRSVSRTPHFMRPLHEITISTKDKLKLLSELTCLMSELGLNIQEAHAFCTIDGYSLDVFVVDSWEKGIDHLKSILVEEILNFEKQGATKQNLVSPIGGLSQSGFMLSPSHVEIPFGGSGVWEIDVRLLNFENKIASGSIGDSYKGQFHSQDVAIKIFKSGCLNGDMQQEFAQEISILSTVQHKNVVKFIGACTRPPLLCIVTEFMSSGSVYDFLHKQKTAFKLPAILKIGIDVSKGMSYLHQKNIIHRDLKAANLLLDENEVVKIADFGVARVQLHSGVMTAETGTYRWMAPELPYANLSPLQAAVGVVQQGLRPTIPRNAHPLLVELLKRCWQQQPSLRPEFSEIVEILQHMNNKIFENGRAAKKRNLGERCQVFGEWPVKREDSGNAA